MTSNHEEYSNDITLKKIEIFSMNLLGFYISLQKK